jgi:hypothetical protein
MTSSANSEWTIVCDKSNNTQESIDQGKLIVDIYVPQSVLNIIVKKNGVIYVK